MLQRRSTPISVLIVGTHSFWNCGYLRRSSSRALSPRPCSHRVRVVPERGSDRPRPSSGDLGATSDSRLVRPAALVTFLRPGPKRRRTLKFPCFGRMRRFSISRRSTDSARWQWPATFGSYLHRFTVLASVLKLHLCLTDGGGAMHCRNRRNEIKAKNDDRYRRVARHA